MSLVRYARTVRIQRHQHSKKFGQSYFPEVWELRRGLTNRKSQKSEKSQFRSPMFSPFRFSPKLFSPNSERTVFTDKGTLFCRVSPNSFESEFTKFCGIGFHSNQWNRFSPYNLGVGFLRNPWNRISPTSVKSDFTESFGIGFH